MWRTCFRGRMKEKVLDDCILLDHLNAHTTAYDTVFDR